MVMSALITRHVHAFNKTFGLGDPIDYYWSHDLYPKEQWDDGDRHWQIDKRNNLFKFWLLWKAKVKAQNHFMLILMKYCILNIFYRAEKVSKVT